MKSLRIILFIFLFSNLCFSQTGWYQVNSGTSKNLYSVFFINLTTGFSVGENGTLLKTVTTGNSWQRININDTIFTLRKVMFKDQSTGFILAFDPNNSNSRIYKTTSGGNNWFISQDQIKNVFISNLEFLNSGIGYMSGGLYFHGANKFFKTTNSGVTWTEIETGIFQGIFSQKFTNENIGFLGMESSIYKTTDGGLTWIKTYENLKSDRINSIKFINDNIGFACGGSVFNQSKQRYIIKTIDGGNTWNYLYQDTLGESINNLLIFNEYVIYGCGGTTLNNSGFVVRTTNGGINWTNEFIPSPNSLFDIANSNTKGFSVGLNGTIFKKDNIVSIAQISTEVPSSINLYQNYPNPFNPETTIKFDIAKSGFISLKVYDISGKEVQNLFNGVKEAGSYQLKFDGANLNSGVYFYRMLTNGNTITKSMVLVK